MAAESWAYEDREIEILQEQIEDLGKHVRHCQKLHCTACQRYQYVKALLYIPFSKPKASEVSA